MGGFTRRIAISVLFFIVQNRYKEVMRIENLHADDLGVHYSASPLECAMSINNLALLYIQQSRFTDAEIMYTMPLFLQRQIVTL
jgi:hypothetical protein